MNVSRMYTQVYHLINLSGPSTNMTFETSEVNQLFFILTTEGNWSVPVKLKGIFVRYFVINET